MQSVQPVAVTVTVLPPREYIQVTALLPSHTTRRGSMADPVAKDLEVFRIGKLQILMPPSLKMYTQGATAAEVGKVVGEIQVGDALRKHVANMAPPTTAVVVVDEDRRALSTCERFPTSKTVCDLLLEHMQQTNAGCNVNGLELRHHDVPMVCTARLRSLPIPWSMFTRQDPFTCRVRKRGRFVRFVVADNRWLLLPRRYVDEDTVEGIQADIADVLGNVCPAHELRVFTAGGLFLAGGTHFGDYDLPSKSCATARLTVFVPRRVVVWKVDSLATDVSELWVCPEFADQTGARVKALVCDAWGLHLRHWELVVAHTGSVLVDDAVVPCSAFSKHDLDTAWLLRKK